MTKSARIMALAAQGKTTREIAQIVWATQTPTQANLSYVRVVRDQRKGTKPSKHDIAYVKATVERRRKYAREWARDRYQTDPIWRAAKIARVRASQQPRIG